jgi:hypothetical protein
MENYADAIVTLMLFLIGAPAVVYQVASNDVREIFMRWGVRRMLMVGHPAFIGGVLIFSVYLITFNMETDQSKIWWDFLIFLLIIGAGYAAVFAIHQTGKQNMSKGLTRKLLKKHNPKARFTKSELSDLHLLGQESKGSEEKDWIIEALQKLTQHTVDSPHYDGTQLEALINVLRSILLDGNSPSTPENYHNAVHLLHTIVWKYIRISEDQPELVQADLGHAIITLKDFGKVAIGFPVAGVTKECLDILEDICGIPNSGIDEIQDDDIGMPNPRASQAIREIGVVALREESNAVAMQALTQLQYMSEDALELLSRNFDNRHALNEVLYDYIGLLAYFWVDGESGAEIATESLRELNDSPDIDLPEFLKDAVEHHKETNRYEIADFVRDMKAGAFFAEKLVYDSNEKGQ